MKRAFPLVVMLLLAADPNRLPQDEAKQYAKLCVEQTTLTDAQISMTVDADKPYAVRGEGGGAMAIPDRKLSAASIENAGKEIVPVGQLWLRKWRPALNGKITPDDKLRIMQINIEGKARPMPLLLLGVRQGAKGRELVVFAKGSEPLLVLPLKKVEFVTELPVEIAWERGEKSSDPLTITILGKYQAVLPVTR